MAAVDSEDGTLSAAAAAQGEESAALLGASGQAGSSAQDLTPAARTASLRLCALLLFFASVQYGLILPTILAYLRSMGMVEDYFLGLSMALFNIGQIIASPILGALSDKFSTRTILMATLILDMLANLLYFSASRVWMILVARALIGMASSGMPIIFAYIARVTSKKERTGVMNRTVAFQQTGLILGPAINLGLSKIDFRIGFLAVTPLNVAGILLAVISGIMFIVVGFLFSDPPPHSDHKYDIDSGENGSASNGSNKQQTEKPTTFFESLVHTTYDAIRALRENMTVAIFTIFFCNFTLLFNQVNLETIVTLLSSRFYGWDQFENSIMYLGIAGVFMVMFAIIQLSLKHVIDPYYILCGLALETTALVFILIEIPSEAESTPLHIFILAVIIFVAGLPCFMVAVPSLFSKIVPKRHQGLFQGVLQVATSVGSIVGPLWGSWSFPHFRLLFGVMLVPLGILLILLALSIRSFHAVYAEDSNSQHVADDLQGSNSESEAGPLLKGP